ncbi:MAG: hypothetical protein AB2556_18535 [Candidatus Thiodiazotropha sp.]
MAPLRSSLHGGWKKKEEDPLDVGDIEVADGIHARAGRLALDARMTDERAARLLDNLQEGGFLLKFLCEQQEGEWAVEDKFDTICVERKKGQAIIEISRDTEPGMLTGNDRVFCQNAYPVSTVAYVLYLMRDTDPANLAPLGDGNLNCVAQRVVEHIEGALRGQGLLPARCQKIQEWEERVHRGGATVDDVAELERIFKRAIILRDIAGENIYDTESTREVAMESEVK